MISVVRLLVVCLIVGLSSPLTTSAQCISQWVKQISGLPIGNLSNSSPSLVIDFQGNVIVSNVVVGADTIITDGQVFPETNSFNPNSDFFIAKYNSEGDLLWLKTILGERECGSLDLAVDANGNIYVGGIMQNSITVDGILIERPPESLPQPGYFILKFNSQGVLQWSQKGDWKSSRCYRLAWTGSDLAFVIPYSDSVSVGGEVFYSDDIAWQQDMVFGRLDEDGNLLNAVNIGGEGNVEVNSFDCDSIGCILQGRFDRELTFDGTTVSTPAENHFELYQMSINSDYGLDWLNHSQSSPAIDPRAYGLSLSGNDDVYFSGFYWNSAFSIAGEQLPVPTENDVFVGHLERSDGNITWLKKGSGNSFDATKCMTSSGNSVWFAGEFYSDVFDYEGSSFTNTPDGENDGFLLSFDSDGKPKCGLQLEGVGQNGILQVESFGDGHVGLLAYLDSTIEFGGQTYDAQGNYDLLVIKTCLPCDTLTGVGEVEKEQAHLSIYPNPLTTQTKLTYRAPQGSRPTMQLRDMLGRLVKTVQLPSNEGTYTLDARGLGAGVYFCTLLNGVEVLATQKLSVTYVSL
ncbi:MAG: T9SS type A sorting domain-containing protein [Flavobacteriales bacterium]|nr:T9SS type A sorting domain-containing protein [Flavobacteriales bacterium]